MTFEPKAWLWFLSSYAPLWVILGLRFHPILLRASMIVLGAAGIAYVVFIVKRNAGERPANTTLTIRGDGGAEVIGYLAAYVLPPGGR